MGDIGHAKDVCSAEWEGGVDRAGGHSVPSSCSLSSAWCRAERGSSPRFDRHAERDLRGEQWQPDRDPAAPAPVRLPCAVWCYARNSEAGSAGGLCRCAVSTACARSQASASTCCSDRIVAELVDTHSSLLALSISPIRHQNSPDRLLSSGLYAIQRYSCVVPQASVLSRPSSGFGLRRIASTVGRELPWRHAAPASVEPGRFLREEGAHAFF